jgi:hypothetical protein
MQMKPVGRTLDQESLHVLGAQPDEIGLEQKPLYAGDECVPGLVPSRLVEFDQMRGIAIGAERQVVLDQVEQSLPMVLMAPGGEAVERSPPGLRVAAGLREHGDELGSEPVAADRDEAVAARRQYLGGAGLDVPNASPARRLRGCRSRGVEHILHVGKLRAERRRRANRTIFAADGPRPYPFG